MPPALVLGAYATAPAEDDGGAFAATLLRRGGAGCGLELPVHGSGLLSNRGAGAGAEGERLLLEALAAAAAPGRRHVVTLVPGTMAQLAANARFGLASDDEAGRAAALAFARLACAAVARVCAATGGRGSVAAVEVPSAPTATAAAAAAAGAASSSAALQRSLAEMRSWDWSGAEIVVEHCDERGGLAPVKGFLPFADELAAVAGAMREGGSDEGAARVGISINWARSVLETRDAARALEHIAAAGEARVLRGLVLSGCGVDAEGAGTSYGAWLDAHMPLDEIAAGSALTRAAAAASARLAVGAAREGGGLLFAGVKITLQPAAAAADARADANAAMLELLRADLAAAEGGEA